MSYLANPAELTRLLAEWGYLGIFVCVFAGNLGVPVPEETVIIAAGFLAAQKILEFKAVWAVVVASAVVGDSCGFLVGRTGGQRLFERLGQNFAFVRSRYELLQAFFAAHGAKAVFMARFVTGARFMAGPMAGAAGMRFWRFLGWNVLGALLWCSLMVTIGYLVGKELGRVARLVHFGAYSVAVVALAALLIALLVWRRQRPEPASGAGPRTTIAHSAPPANRR